MSKPSQIWAKRTLLVIGFVVAVLAFDKLVYFSLATLIDHSQFRFSRLYTGRAKADYVVFGNSRGVHSALPSALGEALCGRAVNLAYNSLSAKAVSILVADYLDRNPPPKAIFVELSAEDDGWIRTVLGAYARQSPRIRAAMAEDTPRQGALDPWIWSRPFFGEALLRALAYMGHDDQAWILDGRSITPAMKADWFAKTPEQRRIALDRLLLSTNPKRLEQFRKIGQSANAHGVPVVFYMAPFHPIVRQTGNGQTAGVMSVIAKGAPPNVSIFDGSATLPEDRLFADRIHLNRDGSRAFVKILAADPAVSPVSACEPAKK